MKSKHILSIVRALGGLKGFVSADAMRTFEKEIPGAKVLAWVRVEAKGRAAVPGWVQTDYDPGEFEVAWADRRGQLKKHESGEMGLLYQNGPEPYYYGVAAYRKVLRWVAEGTIIELCCDGEEADSEEEERDR